MKTYMAKAGEVTRRWHLIDATDQVVGRLAARCATLLMGKHRPEYTPHVDTGDFIVVVNAAKLRFTGRKLQQKVYQRYSGYPSGLKQETAGSLMKRAPERVLKLAVKRMLPKSKLGRHMLSKLKIYAGADHPHAAQDPQPLAL